MSDENQPKGPPGAPVEGRTQAFRFKIDGWMAELMKNDLGVAEDTENAEPAPPEAPPAGAEPPGGAPK
ncbi:MAG: hypothetical protein QM820_46670 [Minicystis sp.]